jgi:O-antigen ligase
MAIFSLRRRISQPSTTALLSALLFVGYVLARAHFSPVACLSRSDMLEAAGCLLVYLLTALYLTEARHRLWVVAALFLIAALEVGVGLVQFAKDPGFMLFGFLRDFTARASGMFVNGNHFAGYLEAIAALALSLCVWGRWPVAGKFLAGYIVVACYVGVAISGSRGGYISSGASLLAFAAASTWIVGLINHRRRYGAMLLSGLLLMFVAAVAANLMFQSQLVSKRMEAIGPSDNRIFYWNAAVDQFRLSPWTGTGSGTYLLYGRLFRNRLVQTDPVHVHNDYLELLAEYGVAGVGLAGLFLISHLASGLRRARRIATRRLNPGGGGRSDALALTLGALATVAALLVHSAVDFNMHMPGNALVFAFFFGILANPGAERPTEAPSWVSLTTLLRFTVPLGGAASLAFLLPAIKGAHLGEQARVALRDKQYSQCIELARGAIAAAPETPDNYFYLGEANRISGLQMPVRAIQIGFFQKAVGAYQEGLKRFPQEENFNLRLGQALDGVGQFAEADQAYRDAISEDPCLGLLYGFYGEHLRLVGAATGARHCLEAARKLGGQEAMESGAPEAQYLLQIYRPD